jgi:hypothetical protein
VPGIDPLDFYKRFVPVMGHLARFSRAPDARQLCAVHHEIWGYNFHQTATAQQLRRPNWPPMMQEKIGGRELL